MSERLIFMGIAAAIAAIAALMRDDDEPSTKPPKPTDKQCADYFERAQKLLEKEAYPEAVLESCKMLAQAIRNVSGLTEDGVDLVNKAFGQKGVLQVVLHGEHGADLQEGVFSLCKGVFLTFRNPVAHHSLEQKMTRGETRAQIEFIAYLTEIVETQTIRKGTWG